MDQVTVDIKSIWLSKTLWTQVIGVLAMVGALFGFDLSPTDQATVIAAIGSVQAVVTVLLKLFAKPTATPTAAKKVV